MAFSGINKNTVYVFIIQIEISPCEGKVHKKFVNSFVANNSSTYIILSTEVKFKTVLLSIKL